MAEAVSKLYAEIGFKVNTEGFKQAQLLLQNLANHLNAINNQAKQSANNLGIFTKKQEQQRKTQIADQVKQNREQERLAKEATRAEEKEQKQRLKNEQAHHRESEKAKKEALKNTRRFISETGRALSYIGSKTFNFLSGSIGESVSRGMALRGMRLQTGVSLRDYQSLAQMAANTGSGMSQEEIMSDIQNVSSNLAKIQLGQGNLSGFKLANVRASAASGSAVNVIREFQQAIQTQGIQKNLAYEIGRSMGMSDKLITSLFTAERAGGNQPKLTEKQLAEIEEVGKAFNQVRYSLENLKDYITATLSPALQTGADVVRASFQTMGQFIEENSELFSSKIKAFAESISNALKDFIEGKEGNILDRLQGAMNGFIKLGEWLSNLFGEKIQEKSNKISETRRIMLPSPTGGTIGGLWDFAKSAAGMMSQTPVVYDNRTLNQTINGVEQQDIAEQASESVRNEFALQGKIRQNAEFAFSNDVVVAGGAVG